MYTLPVFSHSSLLYLMGMFLRFSNSKELSWEKEHLLDKRQLSWSIYSLQNMFYS